MTVREHYDESLRDIRADIVRMGGVVLDMVRAAVDAVLTGDPETSARVVALDDEVDDLETQTVRKTIQVVAMNAPVASDLRMLVATLGVIGEIEKTGDDAVKLARRAVKLTGHFPVEYKLSLNTMGEKVREAFAASLRLYSDFTPELAQQVADAESQVDDLYLDARRQLLEAIARAPQETEHLARTIEAFHALEHMADHAGEIAHRMRLYFESSSAT